MYETCHFHANITVPESMVVLDWHHYLLCLFSEAAQDGAQSCAMPPISAAAQHCSPKHWHNTRHTHTAFFTKPWLSFQSRDIFPCFHKTITALPLLLSQFSHGTTASEDTNGLRYKTQPDCLLPSWASAMATHLNISTLSRMHSFTSSNLTKHSSPPRIISTPQNLKHFPLLTEL